MKTTSEKRKSVRQSILEPTHIVIGEDTYQLANVSSQGIGIQVASGHSFYLGQRVVSIKIETDDVARFFDGTITHLTHQQSGVVCGIRFIFNDIEAYNHMARYVKERCACD
ncbi:PilZ domain-containing protein [Thermodesulfobacteriota bacterium]|jgi:hypothetical protein